MTPLRFLIPALALASVVSAQTPTVPSDPVRAVVGRLDLQRYKAHIKGITQFGDRLQGTQRNRDAIAWLEQQLKNFGYTNVTRQKFMSNSGPLENVYATKVGSTTPGEMYLVSAHMDGRGNGEAADDDGSGCAVVLELARVLSAADVRTNRSVRFISGTTKNSAWTAAGHTRQREGPCRAPPTNRSGWASSSTT
jgi:acetylornithine deacetylase/succinyl-diaminopimelate desuccinylase-like protein